MSRIVRSGLVAALCLLASACANLGEKRENASSSLVSYLYGKDGVPRTPPPAGYSYRLPATVGLAFVPAALSSGGMPLPEALKNQLLEQVKAAFSNRPFIGEIKIVPEAYLRSGESGFQNIEQLSRMYGFDVVALLSYDQLSVSTQKNASLLYWTLAGAYVIKGDRNDVSTFVDTAVFDVATRKLMFRAPGVDQSSASATLIENPRVLNETRQQGFSLATRDMIRHLDAAVTAFHEAREQARSQN